MALLTFGAKYFLDCEGLPHTLQDKQYASHLPLPAKCTTPFLSSHENPRVSPTCQISSGSQNCPWLRSTKIKIWSWLKPILDFTFRTFQKWWWLPFLAHIHHPHKICCLFQPLHRRVWTLCFLTNDFDYYLGAQCASKYKDRASAPLSRQPLPLQAKAKSKT